MANGFRLREPMLQGPIRERRRCGFAVRLHFSLQLRLPELANRPRKLPGEGVETKKAVTVRAGECSYRLAATRSGARWSAPPPLRGQAFEQRVDDEPAALDADNTPEGHRSRRAIDARGCGG